MLDARRASTGADALLDETAAAIQHGWRKAGFRPDALPEIAAAALAAPALAALDPAELLASFVAHGASAVQLPRPAFASPALAVRTLPGFHIDLYCWNRFEIGIHDHPFCGAFRVLAGVNLHVEYDHVLRAELDDRLAVGELQPSLVERLTAGDVRLVRSRDQIHSVYHAGNPAMTLLVRSYEDRRAARQHQYTRTGARISTHVGGSQGWHERQRTLALQAVSTLARVDSRRAEEALRSYLREQPPYWAFHALVDIVSRAGVDSPLFAAGLAAVHDTCAAAADVEAELLEYVRASTLRGLAHGARNEATRYALACLLTLSEPAAIRAALQAHLGADGEAAETLADCFRELHRLDVGEQRRWNPTPLVEAYLSGAAPRIQREARAADSPLLMELTAA